MDGRSDCRGALAYVTTDGGQTVPPPDGIARTAKVLRMEVLENTQ
jgi:hypothetical protein